MRSVSNQKKKADGELFPGDEIECLHRSSASHKRRQKGKLVSIETVRYGH
jgi:hypothetical protein